MRRPRDPPRITSSGGVAKPAIMSALTLTSSITRGVPSSMPVTSLARCAARCPHDLPRDVPTTRASSASRTMPPTASRRGVSHLRRRGRASGSVEGMRVAFDDLVDDAARVLGPGVVAVVELEAVAAEAADAGQVDERETVARREAVEVRDQAIVGIASSRAGRSARGRRAAPASSPGRASRRVRRSCRRSSSRARGPGALRRSAGRGRCGPATGRW